jgi:hypothetical protein
LYGAAILGPLGDHFRIHGVSRLESKFS